MRARVEVDTTDLGAFFEALGAALDGVGPAIVPRASTGLAKPSPESLPTHVPDHVAVVIETSGSTGAGQRVALSAEALRTSAQLTHDRLGGEGVWLLSLPVHYIAGLQVAVRAREAGHPPVPMSLGHFSAERFVEELARHFRDDGMPASRCYASLVPQQLAQLVAFAEAHPDAQATLQRVTSFLIGGQSLAASLRQRAHALGIALVHTYGSTETAGGCVYDGLPLDGIHIDLDKSGEIAVSGPTLALGYLDAERTATRFVTRAGKRWYLTGDVGVLEESTGRLQITGRLDRTIISGGVKVNLNAVGDSLRELMSEPGVLVAVDDDLWGQRPVLVLEGNADEATEDRALRLIRERWGAVAVPERIVWVDSFPLTSSGKPDLHELARIVVD